MRMPFDSEPARELNREIFETIYHAALEASCELAKRDGFYESYPGSPVSKGILQYDMWGVTPGPLWDWKSLKAEIKLHGIRNSLLLAPMPTASTAQILGNNESIEPFTSNIYTRRVLAGEFIVESFYCCCCCCCCCCFLFCLLINQYYTKHTFTKHIKVAYMKMCS